MQVDWRKWGKNAGLILLMLGLISYVIYHCLLFFRGDLTTTVVVRQREQQETSCTAYLFRSERVFTTDNRGAVQYLTAGDGVKVAADTELARVFADGNGTQIFEQLCAVEQQIAFYETCLLGGTVKYNDLPGLSRTVEQEFARVMEALALGDAGSAGEQAQALLVALNQRQVLLGELTGLEQELETLRARRQMLESAYGGAYDSIRTEQSGYYFRETDGYEAIFRPELLTGLTPSGWDRLAGESACDTLGQAGKLVTDFAWYAAVCVPRETGECFEVGKSCDVTFEDGLTLNMTLAVKNGEGDRVMLAFVTTRMPEGFAYTRRQTVTLVTGSTSGLRVPETALVQAEDGSFGVYILDIAYVRYRRVDIIWRGDGYVLVEEYDRSKYGMENELAFLDLVITGADEPLYDGKVYT